ncbi:hypothetical protein MNBD_BACTEROID03-1074 [hydrothermal vent metagenome]|uniref:O-antigen ligase n=1 Tax=hydrothermal vent metagenome TaxID=652676 RepID=A0A3B0T606_9ZZZZ
MAWYKHIKKIGFIISLLLFLYLINPYNLNMYFGYILVALTLTKKQVLLKNLDANFTLLLVFSIIYALFYALDPIGGNQYVFVYALFPSAFYLLGKYIYEQLGGKIMVLFYFLFILGTLFSLTSLISVLLNILEGGFGQLDRSLPLFWNGQVVPATLMGSYFILNMCIPALLVVRQEKSNLLFKIIAIVIYLLSLACVLRLGSRTQIVISLIALFGSLLYIIPRQSMKRNMITFIVFFVGISFLISNVSFDLNQDWLSTFAGRMEKGGASDIASGGGRVERWGKSFEKMFTHPFGWDADEFGHSHNLWLDVLRVSGIIPFIFLVAFSIRSFFNVKAAVRNNRERQTFNNLLIAYFVAFFLVFMVEPIFEGIFELFAIFCLFMGIVNKYRTTQPLNP